jgi:hypothetical protein
MDEGIITTQPLPDDPVERSKGILKGKKSLVESLLEDRKKEARETKVQTNGTRRKS